LLSILNSISTLTAQNSLSAAQAGMQRVLLELSTGKKINSGADDPAGLSIVDGMNANIAALTQSIQNAQNGIGQIQTADGSLSQVGALLNRAVTLATAAANGALTGSQSTALNTEFQSILTEIDQIGGATNFNGSNVFAGAAPTSFTSTQASLTTSTALTSGSVFSIQDAKTGGTFKFKAGAGNTIADLQSAISDAVSAGTLSAGLTASITSGKLVVATSTTGDSLHVSSNDAVFGPFSPASASMSTLRVFSTDGSAGGTSVFTTSLTQPSAAGLNLSSLSLLDPTSAANALSAVKAAIDSVSLSRATLGSSVNQLNAQINVQNTQITNLTSAMNNIQNVDIGQAISQMTQFSILQQLALLAIQQSNQAEQAALKLLQ
jgi:flagellin